MPCKLVLMTTSYLVDEESLPVAVARRLREVMAGIRLTQKDFGDKTGWGRGYVQQRYSGNTPLDVADLEHIQNSTGIQVDYLMREHGPKHLPPTRGGGGGVGLVPPPGLEPGTCGLKDRRFGQKIRRFGRLTVVPAPSDPDRIAA